ncbi:hypothetical protein OEZ86_007355 [Tetradesmus obliquus]|nr:hypothetical protein OEZ86_007355 [Tetradesmus obliquus]
MLLVPWTHGPSVTAQQVFAVSIQGVTTAVLRRSTWSVSSTADRNTVLVPVGANKGWAQVRYTVQFTRTRLAQATYRVQGSVVILELDGRMQVFDPPTVTVTAGSQVLTLPASSITCPSLAVTPRGQLACSFSAEYTGAQPQPGSIGATVSIPGTKLPVVLQAQDVAFGFADAAMLEVGDTADVSNFFEQGPGLLQPAGVSGEQPPPGLLLEDSRLFSYVALFGQLDPSLCGRQWQALSSASVQPSGAEPSQAPQAVRTAVAVQLVGCAFNNPQGPLQPGLAQTPTPPASVPATAPAPALPPRPTPAPMPGVVVAAPGSTLCGGGACPPGWRCFDGFNCCPEEVQVCGGVCCNNNRVCLQNHQQCVQGICCGLGETNCGGRCCGMTNTCLLGRYCVPQGSSVCQGRVCVFPQQCAGGTTCCNPGQQACGGTCCNYACVQNRCLQFGSTVCGPNVCSADRVCFNNQVCCLPTETFCNGGCCPSGSTCRNSMCVPPGSQACGPSVVCSASQFCGNSVTGLCCQRSSQIACGRDCCPASQVCRAWDQRCVAPGYLGWPWAG